MDSPSQKLHVLTGPTHWSPDMALMQAQCRARTAKTQCTLTGSGRIGGVVPPQAPFLAFALRRPHKSSKSLWLAFRSFFLSTQVYPYDPLTSRSLSSTIPLLQESNEVHSCQPLHSFQQSIVNQSTDTILIKQHSQCITRQSLAQPCCLPLPRLSWPRWDPQRSSTLAASTSTTLLPLAHLKGWSRCPQVEPIQPLMMSRTRASPSR